MTINATYNVDEKNLVYTALDMVMGAQAATTENVARALVHIAWKLVDQLPRMDADDIRRGMDDDRITLIGMLNDVQAKWLIW